MTQTRSRHRYLDEMDDLETRAVGTIDLWSVLFPDELVPRILDVVTDAWTEFLSISRPANSDKEVHISKNFRTFLRQHKNRNSLPFRIEREVAEDDVDGTELGRIDLKISHGHLEEVYFAFECKKLNVTDENGRFATLGGVYVTEGVMRFITGQYCRDLDKGGMLGFVMDGDVPRAVNAIQKKMKSLAADLSLVSIPALLPCSLKACEFMKESEHQPSAVLFKIYHVFLAR